MTVLIYFSLCYLIVSLKCVSGSDHRSTLLRTSDFSGSQLMGVLVETENQLQALTKLLETDEFDFWGTPSLNESANILVTSNQRMKFSKLLNRFHLKGQVVIDDVYSMVRTQQKNLVGFKQTTEMTWDAYHYPETIFSWMWQLQSRHSDLVKIITLGRSIEDQPLQLIEISKGSSKGKLGVFIDGGIHAREWISPAVATFIINDLVNNFTRHGDLLDTYNFYILPILNPDGYRHSCNYNRFWRKSRRSFSFLTDLVGCNGIDLNRNWGHHWRDAWGGISPCSFLYAGTAPFSEPETKAIKDFVDENPDLNLKFYFSLHSFGQKWMTPWGYTKKHPEDYDEMMRVAKIGNTALKGVHGTSYRVGSIYETLYTAAGTSSDWFKSIGVDYSYTIELRDYGLYGFLLPASQIIPTSEEVWTGMQASLAEVRQNVLRKKHKPIVWAK